MYCKNCGKELKEGVKFCNGCGAQITADAAPADSAVPAAAETARNRKLIYIIAAAAALIIIVFGIIFAVELSSSKSGGTETQQTASSENSPLTAEGKLLNEYFSNSSYVNDYITPYGNIAEHFVRSQNIFDGFKVIYTGSVASQLAAEDANSFTVAVESEYYYSNSSVTQVVARGTYGASDARLVSNDYVTILGDFGGVSMFSNVDGTNAEYAVLNNCYITEDPEYPKGYEEEDVKKVISSIFGEGGLDIQKSTEIVARSVDTYQFTRIIGNRLETWSFDEYGYCTVSFDGGNTEYSVMFSPDYQKYITYTYISEPYTVKCYDIGGTELWSKEFKSSQDCAFKNDRLYIYADNELHIIEPGDGSDILSPKYYPDKMMYIAADRILLRDSRSSSPDAVIALDLDGEMLWRIGVDSGFSLSDIAVSAAGNELMLTSTKCDTTLNETYTYCRYKRINLETGDVTADFKMPDDYN